MAKNEHEFNPRLNIVGVPANREYSMEGMVRTVTAVLEGETPEDKEQCLRAARFLADKYLTHLVDANAADMCVNDIMIAVDGYANELMQQQPDLDTQAVLFAVRVVTTTAVDHWFKSIAEFVETFTDQEGNERIYNREPVAVKRDLPMEQMTNTEFETAMAKARDVSRHMLEGLEPDKQAYLPDLADSMGYAMRELMQQRSLGSMSAEEFDAWLDQAMTKIRQRHADLPDDQLDGALSAGAHAMREVWMEHNLNARRN